MENHRRRAIPLVLLSVVVVAAACGGAVENAELFDNGQQQGSSSGTSGTAPTPTGTATTSPTPPSPPKQKCDVNFQDDVIGVFEKNGCNAVACHGGPKTINPPRIDGADPTETYQAITAFRLSTGKQYVVVGSTDPKASGMYCNFRGDCGVRMPIGRDKLSSADLQIIDEWLSCGAPFN